MLDQDAIEMANSRLWREHPELGRRALTAGPQDTRLRAEWRQYYAEANALPPLPTVRPATVALPPAITSSPVVGCPGSKNGTPKTRSVESITIKRKNINLAADDKYGHWWFEIDGKESYGWWPKYPVGIQETLGGTDGELNGQTSFGGSATKDPHHGDSVEQEFHPQFDCTDARSDDQIKDCLRNFAKSYSGPWRWTFGAGQNCHTFQEAALQHCGLKES